MLAVPAWLLRREVLLLVGAILLGAGAAVAWYLLQAPVPTIAVAPRHGTAPGRSAARPLGTER